MEIYNYIIKINLVDGTFIEKKDAFSDVPSFEYIRKKYKLYKKDIKNIIITPITKDR